MDSICAVCCLSAMGIGLDWIAASAIQTLEGFDVGRPLPLLFQTEITLSRPTRRSPTPPASSPIFFPSRWPFYVRHSSVEDFGKVRRTKLNPSSTDPRLHGVGLEICRMLKFGTSSFKDFEWNFHVLIPPWTPGMNQEKFRNFSA